MMVELRPGNRTAEMAAAQYVTARGKNGRVISTAAGARALRAVLPHTSYTGRELAQLIAEAAIRKGCNVYFNGNDDS